MILNRGGEFHLRAPEGNEDFHAQIRVRGVDGTMVWVYPTERECKILAKHLGDFVTPEAPLAVAKKEPRRRPLEYVVLALVGALLWIVYYTAIIVAINLSGGYPDGFSCGLLAGIFAFLTTWSLDRVRA